MAKVKFKSGREVNIPDKFVEPNINPEDSIPKEFQDNPEKSWQLAFPYVLIHAEKEMKEYLEYFKKGGEPISFWTFILFKYWSPKPLI